MVSPSANLVVPGLHHRSVGLGRRAERSSEGAARVLVPQVQVRPDPGHHVRYAARRRGFALRPADERLGLAPVHHRVYRRHQRAP